MVNKPGTTYRISPIPFDAGAVYLQHTIVTL